MKIITTCGMGFGTSLMLLMELQSIGAKHGITIEGEALDISSVHGQNCDAIFGSNEIVKSLDGITVPVVGIKNILDKAEIEAKLLELIKSTGSEKG
ncbi:PTS sugar transporter subunit IIB [Cryobacterium aureum]|uniref:PTS sugar transporter subunit IIB n=1 Tax=Cryobacterium aureum TaxID=995037 RepID=UPI000CF54E41|nr:PTS sugar transporter subunit IIB [Cryobacterium aureum]